ncbi:MAG: DUF815 domain-containing protein, partial [Pseudomonadota bacterium]
GNPAIQNGLQRFVVRIIMTKRQVIAEQDETLRPAAKKIKNERSSAISPSEAVEEKVSLSDRFGLWLGFHPCDQDEYLAMIRGYCDAYGVAIDDAILRAEAIEWQATRGSRSGRVAWQYFTDLAGRKGVRLSG